MYHHAVRLCSLGIVAESTIGNVKLTVDLFFSETTDDSCLCFQSDMELSKGKARPKFRITHEQLSHMLENGLTAVQIASRGPFYFLQHAAATCDTFFLLRDKLCVGFKTRNIAFQLISQQCCETSWTFLLLVLP